MSQGYYSRIKKDNFTTTKTNIQLELLGNGLIHGAVQSQINLSLLLLKITSDKELENTINPTDDFLLSAKLLLPNFTNNTINEIEYVLLRCGFKMNFKKKSLFSRAKTYLIKLYKQNAT